jgi:hypothetical protein
MISANPENRPSLEEVIETFEQALDLKKGSSIAKLMEKFQPPETKSIYQAASNPDLAEQSLLSSSSSIQKNLEESKQVQVIEQKLILKEGAFDQAYDEYEKEKDKLLGFRWLLANESTLKTIRELENNRNNKNLQYQKAKDFISKNPHSTFAKKLTRATQDADLIKIIQDAPSRWRRYF